MKEKSKESKKLKKRTKLQIIAIAFLSTFFFVGGLRFFIGWSHNPDNYPRSTLHILNDITIACLIIYCSMEIYYRYKKNRWL